MDKDKGASGKPDRATRQSPSRSVSALRAGIPSAEEALRVELVLQDGSIAVSHIPDSVHNRQLQDYIARHESFALIHARREQVRA